MKISLLDANGRHELSQTQDIYDHENHVFFVFFREPFRFILLFFRRHSRIPSNFQTFSNPMSYYITNIKVAASMRPKYAIQYMQRIAKIAVQNSFNHRSKKIAVVRDV